MERNVYVEELKDFIITECNVLKEICGHGKVTIKGYLENGYTKSVKSILEKNDSLTLMALDDEDKEKVVFVGVILNFSVQKYLEYNELSIILSASTVRMDCEEKSSIFQQNGVTYEDIITFVNGDSGAKSLNIAPLSGSLGHISMQYLETNWNYLQRLASEKNIILVPEYEMKGIKYYIGIPNKGKVEINVTECEKQLDMLEHITKQKNNITTLLADEQTIIIESRKILPIGTVVDINTPSSTYRNMSVYKVEANKRGAMFISKYYMRNREGISTIPIKNYNCIGVSISSSVVNVQGDKLQVSMDLPGIQEDGKYFEFATVYSSTGDAGWYCMPEIGDSVRVYFPNEKEDDAFVFNAMQIDKEGKDPNIKFFRNPQGKEIEFGQDYLKITNNDGLTIILDDKKGISMESDKNINISSNQEINVQSINGKIGIVSTDEIVMKQGEDTSISIHDDVNISGNQVHVKEI